MSNDAMAASEAAWLREPDPADRVDTCHVHGLEHYGDEDCPLCEDVAWEYENNDMGTMHDD